MELRANKKLLYSEHQGSSAWCPVTIWMDGLRGLGTRSKRERIHVYIQLIWRRKRQPTPVSLPRKSRGQRNLVGCSPWAPKESDTTTMTKQEEVIHFTVQRNQQSIVK